MGQAGDGKGNGRVNAKSPRIAARGLAGGDLLTVTFGRQLRALAPPPSNVVCLSKPRAVLLVYTYGTGRGTVHTSDVPPPPAVGVVNSSQLSAQHHIRQRARETRDFSISGTVA